MKTYNKLERDRIPEIIAKSGKHSEVKVLTAAEFTQRLNQKLREEVGEYCDSGDISELADEMEVMCAIVEQQGMSWEEFERIGLSKRQDRRGFAKRLLLIRAQE